MVKANCSLCHSAGSSMCVLDCKMSEGVTTGGDPDVRRQRLGLARPCHFLLIPNNLPPPWRRARGRHDLCGSALRQFTRRAGFRDIADESIAFSSVAGPLPPRSFFLWPSSRATRLTPPPWDPPWHYEGDEGPAHWER